MDSVKPIGRPKRNKAQSKLPVKPRSDRSIMEAYRQRLLNSPSSEKVIKKVFDVALEDGHSHQAACMKLIMDRVLPTSGFSEAVSGGQQKTAIQINISGITPTVDVVEPLDPLDADFTEVGKPE